MEASNQQLKRSLGPMMLWGLGVGYVISGMYFGWNLGLNEGGTGGLAVATLFITLMYICFTFSYTELACAIPRAGGVFAYARRAMGSQWGFVGGMAQNVEFIVAPPAIAYAIGAYVQQFLPEVPVLTTAIIAYLLITALNIYGVEAAASFELLITLIAVVGLILFAGAALPDFEWSNMTQNAWPKGSSGILAALPYAIWFYLAIEGVANVAEETVNPQRNVLVGFGSAILTLVILCFLTFFSSIGVNGWETAVKLEDGSTSDAPLPLVMNHLLGGGHWIAKAVAGIGLFGLLASFHGIILAGGRATYEFGREGYAPAILGKVLPKRQTPAYALLFNMVIGLIILLLFQTGDIIVIACFGALGLYIVSMISLLVLRKKEPQLERPFKVPLYPILPILALAIASIAIVAIAYFNQLFALIFLGIMVISWVLYRLLVHGKTE